VVREHSYGHHPRTALMLCTRGHHRNERIATDNDLESPLNISPDAKQMVA
jgi:hypothetical protein